MQEPHGGADAGVARDHDAADPGAAGDARGVERAVAAEGDHQPLRQVLARFHRVHPARAGHALVDDLADAEGGRAGAEAQDLARPLRQRGLGGGAVDVEPPLGESRGVDIAQRHVGVGHGGGRAALAEGDGAGVRPALSGPTRIRPMRSTLTSDPPPAPISIISITGMRTGMPEPLRNRSARAISNRRAVWGRAPSMRQSFAVVPPMSKESTASSPRSPREPAPRGSRRRRARIRQAGWGCAPRLDGGHAAARGHHEDRAGQPLRRETRSEIREVAGHERLDIGVGDRGAEPVEFPRLGADLVAEREVSSGSAAFRLSRRRSSWAGLA
jgi:hypothetical protein